MKRFTLICAAALLLTVASGCDFLRTVAGRPTSAQLSAKQEMIAAQELSEQLAREREKAVRDSLAALEKHRADSAVAARAFAEIKISQIHSRTMPGLKAEDLPSRYCLVLGGFSQPGNAESFSNLLQRAGYQPVVLHYRRGDNTVVGICPTDEIAELWAVYERVKTEKFFSKDTWILINDTME